MGSARRTSLIKSMKFVDMGQFDNTASTSQVPFMYTKGLSGCLGVAAVPSRKDALLSKKCVLAHFMPSELGTDTKIAEVVKRIEELAGASASLTLVSPAFDAAYIQKFNKQSQEKFAGVSKLTGSQLAVNSMDGI